MMSTEKQPTLNLPIHPKFCFQSQNTSFCTQKLRSECRKPLSEAKKMLSNPPKPHSEPQNHPKVSMQVGGEATRENGGIWGEKEQMSLGRGSRNKMGLTLRKVMGERRRVLGKAWKLNFA